MLWQWQTGEPILSSLYACGMLCVLGFSQSKGKRSVWYLLYNDNVVTTISLCHAMLNKVVQVALILHV